MALWWSLGFQPSIFPEEYQSLVRTVSSSRYPRGLSYSSSVSKRKRQRQRNQAKNKNKKTYKCSFKKQKANKPNYLRWTGFPFTPQGVDFALIWPVWAWEWPSLPSTLCCSSFSACHSCSEPREALGWQVASHPSSSCAPVSGVGPLPAVVSVDASGLP